MAILDDRQAQEAHVVETASATTSASNAQSGNKAYVIAAITVILMFAMGSGLSGCAALALGAIENAYADYSYDYVDDNGNGYDYEFNLDDQMPLQDYNPDEFINMLENNESLEPEVPSTVQDYLDGSLAMYDLTIDSQLSAMSYANADATVREYVREIVLSDRNASSDLHEVLRGAAWGDTDLSEALAAAAEVADAEAEELRGMELPTVECENATEVSRQLELGRTAAIERWTAISAELQVLAGSGEAVDTESLLSADEAVSTAAQEAAAAFSEALSQSRSI